MEAADHDKQILAEKQRRLDHAAKDDNVPDKNENVPIEPNDEAPKTTVRIKA